VLLLTEAGHVQGESIALPLSFLVGTTLQQHCMGGAGNPLIVLRHAGRPPAASETVASPRGWRC
jgi:hypothetical protein